MAARFSKTGTLFWLVIAVGISPRPAPADTERSDPDKIGASEIRISRDFTDRLIPAKPDETSGKMDDAVIYVDRHILIHDLDIAITLTHESFYDLEIILESPSQTKIVLNPKLNGAFVTTDQDGWQTPIGGTSQFTFDDESGISIEDAEPPFDQPLRPAKNNKLSAFDGEDAFGQWRVQILDAWPAHVGRLHRVELIFNAPEPNSVCLFALAGIILQVSKLRKRHKT